MPARQSTVYVSFDDGDRWESLALNLPGTPVSDLVVEDNSIAISTHGRGFYILDDIAPMRLSGADTTNAEMLLYKPADAVRGGGGATITYLLRKPAEKLTIEILDAKGHIVQTIQGALPGERGGGRGRGDGARRLKPVAVRRRPKLGPKRKVAGVDAAARQPRRWRPA